MDTAAQHLLGQACSLGAALTWAVAVVLFRLSGERLPPVALNVYKNLVGMALLALTIPFTGGIALLAGSSPRDLAILAVSGFCGIAVADTLFFYALHRVGVGIVSISEASYSPFAILFSWLLLGERLRGAHYLGAALVLAGLLAVARQPAPAGRRREGLGTGIALAVAAMAFMALGIVMAKPVLERTPLIWATTVRLVSGTASLVLLWLATPWRGELRRVLHPGTGWRWSLPASVLGTYVALLLWTAGFKYTYASVAAILNQTSILFAILLAAPVLGEPLTARKMIALLLALAGVAVVTLAGAGLR